MAKHIQNLLSNLMQSGLDFKVLPSENRIKVDNYTISYQDDAEVYTLRVRFTSLGHYENSAHVVNEVVRLVTNKKV